MTAVSRWPWHLAREVLLIAVLVTVYEVGRALASGHVSSAFANAVEVRHLERLLHLPDERSLQGLLLHHDTLIRLANEYYARVHFPLTGLVLLWLYLRRRSFYLWFRSVLVGLTAAGLVLHFVVPLAPPRMLAGAGFVDTAAVFGPSVYGTSHTGSVANQFAAMPSLHVGWALLVAAGLILTTTGALRWLWLLHPLVTVLVVAVTANHYWLDSIVAAGLLVTVTAIVGRPPACAEVARPPACGAVVESGGGRVRPWGRWARSASRSHVPTRRRARGTRGEHAAGAAAARWDAAGRTAGGPAGIRGVRAGEPAGTARGGGGVRPGAVLRGAAARGRGGRAAGLAGSGVRGAGARGARIRGPRIRGAGAHPLRVAGAGRGARPSGPVRGAGTA